MTERRAKPRRTTAAPRTLAIEVAEEEVRWTCLGTYAPSHLVSEVTAALAAAVELPGHHTTATLMLSSDAEVRELNRQWRGFDKPTNVLSFPMMPPAGATNRDALEIGDIIIAEETLVREALEMKLSPPDHFRHLVLHGLLHLLGYDHESDAEAEAMEALETQILASIGVADPYADSEPHTSATPPVSGSADHLDP